MALQMGHLSDANTKHMDRVTEAEESKSDVQEQIRLFQHRLKETTADNQALHRQVDMLEKRLDVGTFLSCCVFPVKVGMMCPVFLGLMASTTVCSLAQVGIVHSNKCMAIAIQQLLLNPICILVILATFGLMRTAAHVWLPCC